MKDVNLAQLREARMGPKVIEREDGEDDDGGGVENWKAIRGTRIDLAKNERGVIGENQIFQIYTLFAIRAPPAASFWFLNRRNLLGQNFGL